MAFRSDSHSHLEWRGSNFIADRVLTACRHLMKQIDSYVNAIDVYQLDLDWEEICDCVPYLKDKPWYVSKDLPWRDYLANLKATMDCHLTDVEWDGGMLGQRGYFLTLELKASQKQLFLETIGQLRASLARYWQEHQLPEC